MKLHFAEVVGVGAISVCKAGGLGVDDLSWLIVDRIQIATRLLRSDHHNFLLLLSQLLQFLIVLELPWAELNAIIEQVLADILSHHLGTDFSTNFIACLPTDRLLGMRIFLNQVFLYLGSLCLQNLVLFILHLAGRNQEVVIMSLARLHIRQNLGGLHWLLSTFLIVYFVNFGVQV